MSFHEGEGWWYLRFIFPFEKGDTHCCTLPHLSIPSTSDNPGECHKSCEHKDRGVEGPRGVPRAFADGRLQE